MEKITLYYLIIGGKLTRGLGENVKLLLVDSGLEHDYVRLDREETWPEMKLQFAKRGNHRGTVPCIEVGGKLFTGCLPIIRYLSAKLGKYTGSNPEENQYVDTVADGASDWFHELRTAFFAGEEKMKAHIETGLPKWLSIFDKYYGDIEGSYLLGERITFADILVYHMIDNECSTKKLDGYPNLQKLVTAFEERPNIKKYLASLAA